LSKNEGGAAVDTTMFKQMIGSLMYLTATRPDLMYSICLISRYMERSTEIHLQAAKRILRYLKKRLSWGLLTKEVEKKNWWGLLTVIMHETLMIGKALLATSSYLELDQFLGLQRSN
jgi:hypothetical protein